MATQSQGRVLVLLATLMLSASASAQVIAPGHEAEIGAALQLDDPRCEFLGAEIEAARVVAHYSCGDLVLRHASANESSEPSESSELVSGPFSLSGPPELSALVAPRVRGLSIWSIPVGARGRPWWSWLVLALLLLALAGVGGMSQPSQSRGSFAIVALSLGFVAGAAIAGPWGSLHEHNTFIARSDCAYDATCIEDRPGWLPPIYVLYGHLFRLLPYRHASLAAASLVLTLLALLLMNSWLRAETKDERLAAGAVLLVSLHPALPRLAAGVTFWPLALALLFGALRLSVDAKSLRQELAAACAWALALTSSVAFVLLAPLALWSGFRGATRKQALRRVPLGLASMGFVAAFVVPMVRQVDGSSLRVLDSLRQQPLLDERIVPIGLSGLVLVGVLALLIKPGHRGVVLLLLPTLVLGASLETGYPTALLHGFGLLFLYGAVAAFALLWLPDKRRALALVLVLCTYPFASASLQLATRRGPLREELAFIEASAPLLPPHERLIVAPAILEPVPGGHWDGDPIEVRFPRGFYSRDRPEVEIMDFDQWRRIGAPTAGTLAYFGTSLHVFHPSERGEGVRPLLHELERDFAWETVRANEIADDPSELVLPHAPSGRIPLRFARPIPR